MSLLLLLVLTFLPSVKTNNDAVKITVKPQQVYIERRALRQLINFDFRVENLSKETLLIQKIELSVFDKKDKLILRKFLDDNGTRPNIQTIANREVEAKKAQLIFNPFYDFDADVELGKLRYTFSLVSKADEKQVYEAEVVAAPVYYQTKTNLLFPLKGRTIVYDGHDFYAHHRRFDFLNPFLQQFGFNSNFMRYAYDFCPVNAQGEMYKGKYENNTDWLGFGMSIQATGDGKVAAMFDGMADSRSFNEAEIPARPMVIFGNFVVIEHLNGEYSLFAHLKQSSIKVKAGEMVKRGQVIAQIGASGSANIPHLHYELRTGTGVDAEGLPSYFSNFRRVLDSKMTIIQRGQIDTGDIIENR
jgi:murein DD-endopeptidase MepM/ murein hydrolase activator NlpD